MFSMTNGNSVNNGAVLGAVPGGTNQLPGGGGSITVSSWWFRVQPRMG